MDAPGLDFVDVRQEVGEALTNKTCGHASKALSVIVVHDAPALVDVGAQRWLAGSLLRKREVGDAHLNLFAFCCAHECESRSSLARGRAYPCSCPCYIPTPRPQGGTTLDRTLGTGAVRK